MHNGHQQRRAPAAGHRRINPHHSSRHLVSNDSIFPIFGDMTFKANVTAVMNILTYVSFHKVG